MILDSTTKSLQIILGEVKTTNDCDITVSYASQSATSFTAVNGTFHSNGTVAVTVVPAPTVNSNTNANEIRLHNNDTIQHTGTLELNNNSTLYVVETFTLPPGGDWLYTPTTPSQSATPGSVTEVDTDFGITGGPITTTGTLRSTGSALNTQSGDYTVTNADLGKYIVMTKSTAATLTLTAASLRTGWWAIVTQALTGTTAANKVMTITPTTGTIDGAAAGYDYPGAQRLIEFDGTNFNTLLLRGGFLEILNSDSPFTANKPTGCTQHTMWGLGAGGAGGSGQRGAAGTARIGGTGGGGGRWNVTWLPDSYVASTFVFTVPAGPAGGTAITTNTTNGNAGSAAAASTTIVAGSLTYVTAGAGGPGAGGVAATALSGGAGGGLTAGAVGGTSVSQGGSPSIDIATLTQGQFGGANGQVGLGGSNSGQGGSSGAGVTAAGSALTGGSGQAGGGAGGGSGGGITSGNAATAGGNGGRGGPVGSSAGGTAGTSGVNGGNGGTVSTSPSPVGHQEGGGGGGSGFDNTASGTASAGGAGAAGGIGSGGGGGGASLNGSNSGAGGNGGNGLARWWYS